MALALRLLLWLVVLLAPGGFLLLPLLAMNAVKARAGQRQHTLSLALAHSACDIRSDPAHSRL